MVTAQVRSVRQVSPSTAQKWRRPEGGQIKINCDAAGYSSSRQGAIGVLARDHAGNLQGGRHGRILRDSAEELEAKAVLEGVRLAITHGWRNVILESDSATIINGSVFAWRIEPAWIGL